MQIACAVVVTVHVIAINPTRADITTDWTILKHIERISAAFSSFSPMGTTRILIKARGRCEDLRWTGHNNVSEEPYFYSHSSNHIYIQGSVIRFNSISRWRPYLQEIA